MYLRQPSKTKTQRVLKENRQHSFTERYLNFGEKMKCLLVLAKNLLHFHNPLSSCNRTEVTLVSCQGQEASSQMTDRAVNKCEHYVNVQTSVDTRVVNVSDECSTMISKVLDTL